MTIEAILERIATAVEKLATATQTVVVAQPAVEVTPVAAIEKKGPGRPKKVETPAPAPTPVVVEETVTEAANDDDFLNDEPAAPVKPVDKADVRAALVKLQSTWKSPEKSRVILKTFKAETLGSLKESDYAPVIKACQDAMPKAA